MTKVQTVRSNFVSSRPHNAMSLIFQKPSIDRQWGPVSRAFVILACSFIFGPLVSLSHASEENDRDDRWPSWRGPLATGVAVGDSYPTTWDNETNVLWKIPLTDVGGSTPAVWDDSIFITANRDDQNLLLCIDWKGNIRWTKQLGEESKGKHKKGTGCNPSPVTDGQFVYAYYKSGDLGCFRFDGELVWKRNLQEDFAKDTLWWDLGTSPVLSNDYLIVACVQSGPSYLVAFEKATGEVAWKVDRMLDAPEEANQTYSTPQVINYNGEEQLIVLGADHVTAHKVTDGSEIWRVGGLNPTQDKFYRSISSPVVADSMVVAPYARGDSLTGIQLGGMGDVTETHVKWSLGDKEDKGKGADVPTPVVHNGRVIVCGDNGHITCRELESGKQLWEGDLQRGRDSYSASPILAGNLVYFTREDGATFVFKVADGLEVVAKNELDEYTVATPVFVNGKILIRTFENLYCIGQEKVSSK